MKSKEEKPEKVLSSFFDIQKKIASLEGVKYVNGPVPPAIPSVWE